MSDPTEADQAIPTLSDTTPEATKRKTPLVKPVRISLIIDAEGVWTNHLYDSVSVTTVGAELEGFLEDGWSLWGIFMEGMHYLSRIRGNYIMVGRDALVHEAKRGEGGEPGRLHRLRQAGVTDDDIYLAGLTHLSGPPVGVENELWQRRLRRRRLERRHLPRRCRAPRGLPARTPGSDGRARRRLN